MIKIYKYLLPTLTVMLIALFMHILRVQHIQLNLMLSLMMLYMAGMAIGAVLYMFKEDQLSL